MTRGSKLGGTASGQEYNAFHSALLSKCYPKSSMESIGTPVIVKTAQGFRDAGHIRSIGDNPVFIKTVTTSRHLQRNMDAWGIDVRVVNTLKKRNICRIRIIDTESGAIYDTILNVIDNHGVCRDFGYGAQIFLSRKYWFRGESYRFGGSGARYGE